MYTFKSRVRYSEVDINKQLDLFSVINYFQDCSTFQSEDIGLGLEMLESEHKAWILNSWQIIVHHLPTLGENITVGTWAYDFKNMYGYRNFIMKNEDGTLCAVANSIWVLMDTISNRPVKIQPLDFEKYCSEEKYDMEYAPRKINLPKEFHILPSFSVVSSNLDTNNHVNNGQYIKMAEEYVPDNFEMKQLRAEYRISAMLGDIIVPKVNITGDLCVVVLANINGAPYAAIEFSKK